jgi:putative two-component system response regulator
VAVADVFDVITHGRPYKQPSSVEDAIARVREDAGRHFDPAVVDAFMRVIESGRLAEVARRDSPAREGSPRELTASGLQPSLTH